MPRNPLYVFIVPASSRASSRSAYLLARRNRGRRLTAGPDATVSLGGMNNKPGGEVTQLLLRWRAGDEAALAALLPLVYEELRSLARRHLRHERGSHTLQRTALVHEAFLRIVDQKQVDWESRSQFYGIASQMMRRILVDHARRRSAAKRGDGAPHVDLDAVLLAEGRDVDADRAQSRRCRRQSRRSISRRSTTR